MEFRAFKIGGEETTSSYLGVSEKVHYSIKEIEEVGWICGSIERLNWRNF